MNSTNASTIWTLDDFISEYAAEELRIDAFFLKQVFWEQAYMKHKIVVNESSIVDKYMNELESTKRIVELTTKEYYKYRYNPKLLSYEIYGTTELWFFILMANELYSSTEFDLRKVILFDATIITKVNRMLEMDNDFLEINSMEVKSETDESV